MDLLDLGSSSDTVVVFPDIFSFPDKQVQKRQESSSAVPDEPLHSRDLDTFEATQLLSAYQTPFKSTHFHPQKSPFRAASEETCLYPVLLRWKKSRLAHTQSNVISLIDRRPFSERISPDIQLFERSGKLAEFMLAFNSMLRSRKVLSNHARQNQVSIDAISSDLSYDLQSQWKWIQRKAKKRLSNAIVFSPMIDAPFFNHSHQFDDSSDSPQFTFCALLRDTPYEIVSKIVSYLSNGDLFSLASCSRDFLYLTRHHLIPAKSCFDIHAFLFASDTYMACARSTKQPLYEMHDLFSMDFLTPGSIKEYTVGCRANNFVSAVTSRPIEYLINGRHNSYKQHSGDAFVLKTLAHLPTDKLNISSLSIWFRGSRVKKWGPDKVQLKYKTTIQAFHFCLFRILYNSPRLSRLVLKNAGDFFSVSPSSIAMFIDPNILNKLVEFQVHYTCMDMDQSAGFNVKLLSPSLFYSTYRTLSIQGIQSLSASPFSQMSSLHLELFLDDQNAKVTSLMTLKSLGQSIFRLSHLSLKLEMDLHGALPDVGLVTKTIDDIFQRHAKLRTLKLICPCRSLHTGSREEWLSILWEGMFESMARYLFSLTVLSLEYGRAHFKPRHTLKCMSQLKWLSLSGSHMTTVFILKSYGTRRPYLKGIDLTLQKAKHISSSALPRLFAARQTQFKKVTHFRLALAAHCSIHLEDPKWISFLSQLKHVKMVSDSSRALRPSEFSGLQFITSHGQKLKSFSWDRSFPALRGYKDDWSIEVMSAASFFFKQTISSKPRTAFILNGLPISMDDISSIIPKLRDKTLPSLYVTIPLAVYNSTDIFAKLRGMFQGPLFDPVSFDVYISPTPSHLVRPLTDGSTWLDLLGTDCPLDLSYFDHAVLSYSH